MENKSNELSYVIGDFENGECMTTETCESFESMLKELPSHFDWISDNEPEKELPNFENCTTMREVQAILDEFDYKWFTVKVWYMEGLAEFFYRK